MVAVSRLKNSSDSYISIWLGLTAITRWRVSKNVVQYSYMNFISGNRMLPPVLRNFR